MIDLSAVFLEHQECLVDRQQLKELLIDLFPTQKRDCNILMAIYESDYWSKIKNSVSFEDESIHYWAQMISQDTGISDGLIIEGIHAWINGQSTCAAINDWKSRRRMRLFLEEDDPLYSVDGIIATFQFLSDGEVHFSTEGKLYHRTISSMGKAWFLAPVNGTDKDNLADPNLKISRNVLEKYIGPGGIVYIPEGVTTIGEEAFSCCTDLIGVIIPESVTVIGDKAFEACMNLVEITIPKNIIKIGWKSFFGCKSLTEIIIPGSVKKIDGRAFMSCAGLINVTLLEGIAAIDNLAFANCMNLTNITIPQSVTTIGEKAFANCENLTINTSAGSAAEQFATTHQFPCYLKDCSRETSIGKKSYTTSKDVVCALHHINCKEDVQNPTSNPNNLNLCKSSYKKGVTVLFVQRNGEMLPAIFDHFDVKNGKDVIYLRCQGKVSFYAFPQTELVFPRKADHLVQPRRMGFSDEDLAEYYYEDEDSGDSHEDYWYDYHRDDGDEDEDY